MSFGEKRGKKKVKIKTQNEKVVETDRDTPYTQDVNSTYIRRSEDVLNVF